MYYYTHHSYFITMCIHVDCCTVLCLLVPILLCHPEFFTWMHKVCIALGANKQIYYV